LVGVAYQVAADIGRRKNATAASGA
jgi:hypothetical protein